MQPLDPLPSVSGTRPPGAAPPLPGPQVAEFIHPAQFSSRGVLPPLCGQQGLPVDSRFNQIVQALINCSRPYKVRCTAGGLLVPNFYWAPGDPRGLSALASDFPKQSLIEAGLFTKEPFEPLIAQSAPFVVLRDCSNRVIDVLHGGGCLTGRLPLFQILYDKHFQDAQRGGDPICLVRTISDMALLRLAGIRTCLDVGWATASPSAHSELIHMLGWLPRLDGRLDGQSEIMFCDWRIDKAAYIPRAALDELLVGRARHDEVPYGRQTQFELWRPSPGRLELIRFARQHDVLWLKELLPQSFREDLRTIDERDRPLADGPAQSRYLLQRLYAIALESRGKVAADCEWILSAREYSAARHKQLVSQILPLATCQTTDACAQLAAGLRRFMADIALPDFLTGVAAELTSKAPPSTERALARVDFRRFQQAAEETARSARKLLSYRRRRSSRAALKKRHHSANFASKSNTGYASPR